MIICTLVQYTVPSTEYYMGVYGKLTDYYRNKNNKYFRRTQHLYNNNKMSISSHIEIGY